MNSKVMVSSFKDSFNGGFVISLNFAMDGMRLLLELCISKLWATSTYLILLICHYSSFILK